MTRRRAPADVRRLALVWCFDNLEDGLDDVRLAALWLQDRLDRGQEAAAVPPNLLAALDTADARLALEELERDRLLARRRSGGHQLTDAGLVLARAMKGATATAAAAVERLELTPQDAAFVAERERVLADFDQDVLRGGGTGVPRGLLDDGDTTGRAP